MNMRISMSMSVCKQTRPFLYIPNGSSGLDMRVPEKEKVVVIMGATGTGKSRLSIDLASSFPAEVVNSDKMQVYEGLDIVTNKITEEEKCGVPHHLLGVIEPEADFTATHFVHSASNAMKSIISREQLPIIVGGSNSFIEALVDDDKENSFRSKYEYCFLWVDVSMPVLQSFICERVDKMVQKGMFEEVKEMFRPDADYSKGIRRAIGAPEFDHFFRVEQFVNKETRAKLLEQAINMIKINTNKLAFRQTEKIHRLKNLKGWKLHRLDATDVFRKRGIDADEAWDRLVAQPSTEIVNKFLYDFRPMIFQAAAVRGSASMGKKAVAAATR